MKSPVNKWELLVRKARQFIVNYESVRFRIAKFAIEACDITRGGTKGDETVTLSKFARDIDLHPKTLIEWVAIQRLVIAKLPKKVQEKPNDVPFDVFKRVRARVYPEMKAKEVQRIFREEQGANPVILRMTKYLAHLRSVLYNAQRPILMAEVPEHLILDVRNTAQMIATLLDKELELRKRMNPPKEGEK